MDATAEDRLPQVTVIVPVYQAGATLEGALRALLSSDYPNFDVLAVDDGSTDESLAILRGLRGLGVSVLSTSHRGCAAARNRGIVEAKGEILFFTDADVEVAVDTLRRGVNHFLNDRELAAVFGSYTAEAGAPGFATAYKNYVHHYTHQNARAEAWTFWTGCGFVRREVARRLGGFDEGQRFLSDVEFGYRMQRAEERVRLDREMQVLHRKHYTLRGQLRSDFFGRAVPWSRLILRYKSLQPDLNLGWSRLLSVAVAAAIALALGATALFGPASLAFVGLGLISLAWLNRGFLRFVYRREGISFALRALGLHALVDLLSGVGAAAALCGFRSGGR